MRTAAPALNAAEGAASAGSGARGLLGRQLHIATRLFEAGCKVVDRMWRGATVRFPRRFEAKAFAAAHPKVWRALGMALLLRDRLLAGLQAPPGPRSSDATAGGSCEHEDELASFRRELAGYERFGSVSRPLDGLKRYVMTRPVETLLEEIREGLGFSPDWLRQAEAEWARMQQTQAPQDLPPLGEAPPEGRGRGPQRGAFPPPSSPRPSAGATLSPQGEEPPVPADSG